MFRAIADSKLTIGAPPPRVELQPVVTFDVSNGEGVVVAAFDEPDVVELWNTFCCYLCLHIPVVLPDVVLVFTL